MSWLNRKSKASGTADHDPCIDMARQALGQNATDDDDNRRHRDRTTDNPHGVDAGFCYGGENKPCA
jgi:hypothetical protein